MEIIAILIFIIATFLSAVYLFFQKRFTYWKSLGIPHEEPTFPYGNFKGVNRTIHVSEFTQNMYNYKVKEIPFVGMHIFYNHSILPTDLDLIKAILIKDFSYFTDHGMFTNEKDDPLSAHLFMLDGQEWRSMRNKLSTTFTSGKIKMMFETFVTVATELEKTIHDIISKENNDVLEVKDLLERYTTDVIGSCAFGIECNSLKDPNTEFRVIGREAFREHRNSELLEGLITLFPNLAKKLGMKIIKDNVSEFFLRVVRDTIEYREKHNIKRNDFMNILLQLKKKGDSDHDDDGLTIEQIAAQLFVFFIAGFETSSAAMSFTLYELALNLEIQENLREEINDVLMKHNGNITYEAIKEMTYLEQVIKESLRKYPPLSNLLRKSVKAYKIPDFDYILEKGSYILIPVQGIHSDPDIYENPEIFDPERFSPENIKSRHSCAYLPFGDGPRNCIGLRFGLMQIRVGLIFMLKNFRLLNTSMNKYPMEFDVKSPISNSKHGIFLKFEKIE